MEPILEILNECLIDSNLETVTKAELRKKYLAKTGLTKLPKEDKSQFASAVNTAYLNYISTKTKATDIADNLKIVESPNDEIKGNCEGEKLIMDSCSEDDITPANINEDVIADQFASGVNVMQMEQSSDSDEKSLASYKNNAIKKLSNGIKKQRSKRTLTSSSEDETIEIKSVKRKKVLKKASKSSDSRTKCIAKSEEKENVSGIKNRFKKAIVDSSDLEEEPLIALQKKSNSSSGSLNSMNKSDESENECHLKSVTKQLNNPIDSEDEPVRSSTKKKTNSINDLKNHSCDSEDEPLTKFQKSYDSTHSNGKTRKFKTKQKSNGPDFDMKSKNSSSDSENEPLTIYRKCNDSIHSDENLNSFTKKKGNSSNKSFKPIESTSESEDEPILTLTKRKSNLLNKSCVSENSSETENESLAKYSKKKVNISVDSDDEPLTTLTKKSNSNNGSLKSMKNLSDSEDEPLSNLNNKNTDNSSDSEMEPDEKIVKSKVKHYSKKPVTNSSKFQERFLKKKKFVDSDEEDVDANISNQKQEKSFHGLKNCLSDSNEDEPLNKLSTKKLDKKRKSSESGSNSFVDENEEHSNKKNKPSKRKEANDSGKQGRKLPSASENKIENLKKYLRVAGIRISNYKKLFENCKTMKAKCEKLMSLLEKEGLKGRPTLEKCKKLRKKIETKREIAELDMSNILKVEGGRPKRSVCSDTTNCEPEQENSTPIKKFSRLQDIIDSEESD